MKRTKYFNMLDITGIGFRVRHLTGCLVIILLTISAMSDDRIPLKLSFLSSTSGDTKLFAGAFFQALDKVNRNATLLEGFRLDYLFNDTRHNSLKAINAMTSHHRNDTIGFIGPDVSCQCEATVAAAWNMPMIGYKCHDSKTGNVNEELQNRRTFARTQPSTYKVSKSIISILEHYKWKRVSLVIGASAIWNETAESLKNLMKDHNIVVKDTQYFKEPYAFNQEMYNIVESTHKDTRIYVFLGDNHGLVDFSRLLKGVLEDTISEYVIIAVDKRFYTEDPLAYLLKTPFEGKDDLNSLKIKSFETVLLLVPRPPLNSQWEAFLDDVRERNSKPPINSLLKKEYAGKPIKVPIYAAYLYDAVYTYAQALDKVIRNAAENSTDLSDVINKIRNGTEVISHIRNKTFTSILGYEVYVDMLGDAEGNYTLLTFDVHRKDGDVELVPAANFRMTRNGVGIPELNLFREIKWKNGVPPPDEPECGFYGEKCTKEFEWRILAICIIIAIVSAIAGGFFLRHYFYEQKLARLLWKVDFRDIVLVDSVDEIFPPTRKKRKISKSHPFKFIFTLENESERTTLLGESRRECSTGSINSKRNMVGSYKGTIVSLKHIIKKNVEIDRDLKKQLQLRKELNHDNIARFIGACVDTPHVYILTQFCQRGSLQDILMNEDFSLDDMFVSSLVSDLIKAMVFIHESEIGCHGNLKSSNCLVDSRWVLMVSDFGLHKLVSDRSGSTSDINRCYDRLLWRAPELLQNTSRDLAGTQKGDVYAFAFILYEMIGRKGPWGDTQFSSKDIIETLKRGTTFFRPDTSALTCEPFVRECIHDCWLEDPEHRPDYKYIRMRLKPMLQGIKSNIFDNMLDMMETYANNLESVVAERTELLSEEKKMTENLLLRMLPRFVADRLKKGEPVVPELYDSVSIYFSDIVGFTALSAESTPMEVVCMLNDLYTCFDAIVENYDVYKIETIGDAYFVVSGLPLRNEDLHAGEVASMSLHMLREIMNFKIRHRPNDTLKLRIGIHSGPCVAGVVGLKMPRYTLFGDTVNTASRMESTGVPSKIHCSETVTNLLRKLGGYHLVERGYITAKGKGEMLTYFLDGEDESQRQRRISLSKFSKTNVPIGEDFGSTADIFGAPILNRKYWPSSSPGSPTFLDTIPQLTLCDNTVHSEKATCDKQEENIYDGVFTNNVNNRLNSVTESETISLQSETEPITQTILSSTNPFKMLNPRYPMDRQLSLNIPLLSECNGYVGEFIDSNCGTDVFEKAPRINKPELQRNLSLPEQRMAEDYV